MSTDAATFTDTSSASPAPSTIEVSNGDEMTPAERAYFDSRGQDTSGLSTPAPAAKPAAKAVQAPANDDAAVEEGEDAVEGEITIDEQGNAKDRKTGRFVPKSAMLRYKGEAKEYKETAQKMRDFLIAARERLAILTEATAPAKAANSDGVVDDLADAPDIDPETDVFGALKQANARLAKFQKEIASTKAQTTDMQRRAAFENDVRSYMQQNAPDWKDAFDYLYQQRNAELEAVGIPPEHRAAQISQEAQELINNALGQRRSAAELLYKIAQSRGYAPKAAKSDKNALAEAEQQIKQLEQNKASTTSMRGAGTGAVGEQVTLAKLADMGEDEYLRTRDAYVAKHGPAKWRQLLGG